MENTKSINLKDLEKVTGGTKDTVQNPHKGYTYANVREEPSTYSPVMTTLDNGTKVEPTGQVVTNDGTDWYQVHIKGYSQAGWIAGNLLTSGE